MACKTNVILRIFGEDYFNVEDITKSLLIQPKEAWQKGETSLHGVLRTYNCWSYETGYSETFEIDEVLNSILKVFYPKKEILKEISTGNTDTAISLDIVIKMGDKDTPSLFFPKEFIHFLSFIEAEVDVDMYINS